LSAALRRLNARHPWNHNDWFHGWVLANLPEPCSVALDVGCGRGELLAALARQADRVIGTDADATMRDEARRRCAGLADVTVSDRTWPADEEPLDLITMVAVLHHVDAVEALQEVRRRLRPGGRFLAVGLARPVTLNDWAWDVASVVTNPLIGYVTHPWPADPGRTPPPPFPLREPTLSFDELREVLDRVLPGAVLRHRLGFRHTIAWTKPLPEPAPDDRRPL
jgi:SAM-dependent methyltransferase